MLAMIQVDFLGIREVDSASNHPCYMEGLAAWEASFVASGGKRVAKGSVRELVFPTKVEAEQGSRMVFSKDLGVHWPLPLFERQCKRKAERSEIVYLDDDCGGKVAGVVLPSAQGCPTGCTKISKEWFKGARKSQLLSDSKEQLRAGQTNDAFKAATAQVNTFDVKPPAEGQDQDEDAPLKAGRGQGPLSVRAHATPPVGLFLV